MLPQLSRARFIEVAQEFTQWAVNTIDWAEQLRTYEWRGEGFEQAVASRRDRTTSLSGAKDERARRECVDAITTWGGVPRLEDADLTAVLESLPALDALALSGGSGIDVFHARRIASVSKVYASFRPNDWVIYDSRVAHALAQLVTRWEAESGRPMDELHFPQPAARSGTSPLPGFPRVSDSAPRQGGRAFVYASWWCAEVAHRLSTACPDPAGWAPTHIEMSLFMIGKPTGGEIVTSIPGGGGPMVGAAMAGKAIQSAARSDQLQDAVREQFLNQIQKREAKQRAARYAHQTGSELANVQYADGLQRWTVFKDKTPIATFPGFSGDLASALLHHDLDRLELRDPESVQEEAEEEKETKKIKVPDWMPWFGAGDEKDDQPPEIRYLLEAGDE